jgi:RecA/RadA recombinase
MAEKKASKAALGELKKLAAAKKKGKPGERGGKAGETVVAAAPSAYGEFDRAALLRPPDANAAAKRLLQIGKLAKELGVRPAREVLTPVIAVPTDFVQVDLATRVYGWPIERITIIHGPSNEGKTLTALGLGLSFLRRGHLFLYVDAEFTTPQQWLQTLMAQHFDHPGFVAMRPRTYEETVDSVRKFVRGVAAAREAGSIPPDTTAFVVVDSIKRLVPEDFWARIRQHGAQGKAGSVDGYGGRGGMILAKMNADWLQELIPLLFHTKCGLCIIGRESDDQDADKWDKLAERDWRLTGGGALKFDSSLIVRCTRAGYVTEGAGEEEKKRVIGERHKLRIWKTKVGGKDGKYTDAFFHTSNGAVAPEGYDRARDIIELAKRFGTVTGDAWLTWVGGDSKWNGVNAAVRELSRNKEMLEKLEAEVRANFSSAIETEDAAAEEAVEE